MGCIHKSFKVTMHTKQVIKHKAEDNKIPMRKLVQEICDIFINEYIIHSQDHNYIRFINGEYLEFMMDKYKMIPNMNETCKVRIGDYSNSYIMNTYNHLKFLELATFFYFNILPEDLRTYK